MNDSTYIPDGELFADFQQSMTDIFLLEVLKDRTELTPEQTHRLEKEKEMLEVMKRMIRGRFNEVDLTRFLVKGYPRQINISRIVK